MVLLTAVMLFKMPNSKIGEIESVNEDPPKAPHIV